MKAALCNCRESVTALLAAGADPAAALPSGLSADLWAHWHAAPACLEKSLVQVVRSNLPAPTQSTTFYPLLRPRLLQPSFGTKRLTPPRLRNTNFWQPASTSIWSKM